MNQLDYTPYYCEENIWRLCANPLVAGHCNKVVWISSLQQHCPLWHQRAAGRPDQPVWWDYHVILLSFTEQCQVWDLDTTLPLPVNAADYLAGTFPEHGGVSPLFRVMDADYYRANFSSDRSHMRNSNGVWMASPPLWPAIVPHPPTFSQMRDFNALEHGDILTLDELKALVSDGMRFI